MDLRVSRTFNLPDEVADDLIERLSAAGEQMTASQITYARSDPRTRPPRGSVWKVDELTALLSAAEATPIKRGTYRRTRERKAIERGEKISD